MSDPVIVGRARRAGEAGDEPARALRALVEMSKLRAAFVNWPSIATRGLLWKHLGLPPGELELVSRGGARIRAPLVHNVGAVYAAIDVFAFNAYACEWNLENEPVVVDVGANIGSYVVWLAERHPQLRGVCYEPDPEAARYLRTNLELNRLVGCVDVRAEAVTDRTGDATLFQAAPGDGASSLRSRSHATRLEREISVPTVSFGDAMGRIESEISVLKIDCEGAEYDFVTRSSDSAWEHIKRVVIEYHPASPDEQEALRGRLAALGFLVFRERRRSADEGTLWLVRPGLTGSDHLRSR